VRLAPNAAPRAGLSRDHAAERTHHNCAVATIVEFNVDRPQDCDRNAGCKKLLHVQYPSSQWDEDSVRPAIFNSETSLEKLRFQCRNRSFSNTSSPLPRRRGSDPEQQCEDEGKRSRDPGTVRDPSLSLYGRGH
jgi:hypothetical protein